MTPLTVLSVAYPFAPVAPDVAGGAEQVLLAIDSALCRAGHRSIVVAQAGSRVEGELEPIDVPSDYSDEVTRARVWSRVQERVTQVALGQRADVVHLHGVDFSNYLPDSRVPALVTLHLPRTFYPRTALAARRNVSLACVSDAQRRSFAGAATIACVVPNGVDLTRLSPRPGPRANHAVALGRICPEKGYHLAFDGARQAGVPLLLAGDVFPYPEHVSYLNEQILPRQDAYRRFIGRADFARKRALLQSARCLVVPSLVPETSSLVAMEALACGTPVVAYRQGALPELIEHGVTGYVVDNVAEMAAAIEASAALDPRACRSAAERRCNLQRTNFEYFELYRALANQATAGVVPA